LFENLFSLQLLERDIYNWGTTFWTQDPRTLFLLFPNTKSTRNKFKCKLLDNSNYANFHGGGDFSHAYVIMHQYCGKKPKMQNMNT
jgi:hypothetical protein